ncbi:hypothetical protein GTY62_15280 [Streptomyces sp. SID724]|uniref:C40 family peptidase n=1 Tax=Streptomyces sp. SID724 TaxID=2690324 RepID=UPI0013610A85|nr:hypothetical protein [Streptomyces sp. SID724]
MVLATAGGVLLYAGFQGQNPLQALKDITSGKTKQLVPTQVSFVNDPTTGGGGGLGLGGGGGTIQAGLSGGTHPEIAEAAMRHQGERYSQARRWEPGYSDCSSFVGKSLKDLGITPPGASVTGSYLVWNKLRTISRADIGAGDLLCGSGHIAIALSPTTAIGQQNGRQNVRIDSIPNIMYGQASWSPRRYIGTSGGSGPAVVAT